MKNMKGGVINNIEILSNYYLCTQSRYDKPIIDQLLPFGSFKELDSEYGKKSDIEFIKNLSVNIPNKKVVGSSQYGIYFRLVKKEFINSSLINSSNNINFKKNRSFIFDINRFLEYVYSYTRSIPLLWYANGNAYGYRKGSIKTISLYRHKTIKDFLSNVGNDIEKNLYDHEFVCRIPIPLNEDSGFMGKINKDILSINQELKLQKNLEEKLQKNLEKEWQKNWEEQWQKNLEEKYQKNWEEKYQKNWEEQYQKNWEEEWKDNLYNEKNHIQWISGTGKKINGYIKDHNIKKGKNGKNRLTISNIFSKNGMTQHGKNVNIETSKLQKYSKFDKNNIVEWKSDTNKNMFGTVKNGIIKKGNNDKNILTITNIFSKNGTIQHCKNENINFNKLY